MKIESVLFENFIAILTGLGKHKLFIDFTNCKNLITLIVGPMGSAKTTILSHLIPSAHVGTLDERNSNPIVIEGLDGKKELVYNDQGDIYKVTFKYLWNKDHHTIKSFISKNGVELNENGNQNSFKELAENELGFNADLVRLLRLGPNVSNVIELPSVERKEFIARQQQSVDLYLSIYKDMKEKTRALTAQSQLLARKLVGITDDDINDMRTHNEDLSNKVKDTEGEIVELSASLGDLETENRIYLDGRSSDEFSSYMDTLKVTISKMQNELVSNEYEVKNTMSKYKTTDEILKELGKCEADINNNRQLITSLNMDTKQFDQKRAELSNKLQTLGDDEYISHLQDEYKFCMEELSKLKEVTEGFTCELNSEEIRAIIGQIQVMDLELNSMIQENPDVVRALVKGSSGMIENSRTQIDILQARIIKLQRSAANIKFIDGYDVSDELALPKACKMFELCPFFYTHPNNVKKSSTDSPAAQLKKIQEEISLLNSRIDEYSAYPSVWAKLEHCRKLFNSVAPKLHKLGVLKTKSVDSILTNTMTRIWYDNDKLVDILERCVKREQLAVNELKAIELKRTLDKSMSLNITELQKEYDEVLKHLQANKDAVKDIETAITSIEQDAHSLQEDLAIMQNLDKIKENNRKLKSDIEFKLKEFDVATAHNKTITSNLGTIAKLRVLIDDRKAMLNAYKAELTANIVKLNSIVECQREYAAIAEDLKILNLIIKASSPKTGIPLLYIQTFLNDCVDDINSMLANVLPDIEVCEFVINDKEFKIPYRKSGVLIEDVSYASQGERALIETAFSFALMMKNGSKYNIPLLDEVDGPVHSVSRRSILLIFTKYFQRIGAEQAFCITHNDIFEGQPVDIISTSADEHLTNKQGELIILS